MTMWTKRALILAVALLCASLGVFAQQPATPAPPVSPETEQWMRKAWGVDPKIMGQTDTHFLLSLSEAERQGAFLFKQRCNLCHYSQIASIGGAKDGLLTSASYGPALSKKDIDGREDAVRKKIVEGSERMPAYKYSLQPAQVDMIIGYLKRVDNLRPVWLDRTLETTRQAIPHVSVAGK